MSTTLKLSASGLEKVSSKLKDVLGHGAQNEKNRFQAVDRKSSKSKKSVKNQAEKHLKETKPKKAQSDPKKALEDFLKKRGKTLMWLCKHYPKCFSIKDPVPLKIGIIEDIFAVVPKIMSKTILRKVLKRYTRTARYLNALVSNPHRYNLEGERVGEVTAKERSFAKTTIDSFAKSFDAGGC